MKKRKVIGGFMAVLTALSLCGCGANVSGSGQTVKVKLDPNHPVSLSIWHYYNGTQQAIFDSLVEEFNATTGKDEGIYVEGHSQGSVSDLEQAVNSALNGEVGAEDLPDIFSSYADTAYAVQQQGKLTDLTQYFSEEELSAYVDSYIQDGKFNDDGALYLLPVAKSTEILMLNKTDWKPFAEATGATLDDLTTTEGIVKVAQQYYEWTDSLTPDVPDDGKAFYGRDSMSNYFVIGMKQMGKELFEVEDGKVTLNTDEDLIRRLWDDYYVPFVKGYFGAYGKFRSDDVKTGDILAYTGSTVSVPYFPDNVETDEGAYPIEYIVQQAPVMEGGENVKVQQGAGMAVTKSDEQHEYAASVFLKWFTEKDHNMQFVCSSSYMPVLKEANTVEALDEAVEQSSEPVNEKVYTSLKTVLKDFEHTDYYTTKTFDHAYDARKVLDYNLSDKAAADKAAIDEAVAGGMSREDAEKDYISDAAFESWYSDFCTALSEAVNP